MAELVQTGPTCPKCSQSEEGFLVTCPEYITYNYRQGDWDRETGDYLASNPIPSMSYTLECKGCGHEFASLPFE